MIAVDNSGEANFVGPASSLTYSATVGSGADRILFVGCWGDTATDVITGATYAGQAMTLIDKQAPSGDRWTYLFYIVAPASGANNIIISASSSIFIGSSWASYTGAVQTGIPHASSKNVGAVPTSTITTTLTTTKSGVWLVLYSKAGATDPIASTGATERSTGGNGNDSMFDSNGAVSIGSNSMILTASAAAGIETVMAAFEGTPSNSTLLLMGVG